MSDLSGQPDRPEHPQEVMWALDGLDGKTDLSITERNIPSEQAKAVSDESWTMVLENLKKLRQS